MKRAIFVALLLLAITCLLVPITSAETYFVANSWYLQHRVYEDGRDFYRLEFGLKTTCPTDLCPFMLEDIVSKVEIYESQNEYGGEPWVLFDTYTRYAHEIKVLAETDVYPYYDTVNCRWFYQLDTTTHKLNWLSEYYYEVNLTKNKPVDMTWYKIVVYTDSGQVLTPVSPNDQKLLYLTTLPVIQARTIGSFFDQDGNLIITWKPPYSYDPPLNPFGTSTNPYRNVRERLYITLANEPHFLQDLLITLPTHMGQWFVPKEIIDQIKETLAELRREGYDVPTNRVSVSVAVRTLDNGNRTYSNTKSICLDQWCFGEDQWHF
ncbi:MAG TPA: hypothetical protein VMT57_08280 [Candidatus Thermoplasmatota archaeon]|jgi:hypothetical protein|nr:hypothetical protein [Candidatus Thermoplasmatota archaeon]